MEGGDALHSVASSGPDRVGVVSAISTYPIAPAPRGREVTRGCIQGDVGREKGEEEGTQHPASG